MSVRPILVRLHRWFGLGTAVFLFLSGLTGSIIAWHRELDAALNPAFFYAHTSGPALPSLELAKRVEAADPRLRVTWLPLAAEPGRTLQVLVAPRNDPHTGKPYALDFNQLAIDPATGAVQGRREWGALSLSRLNLLPFLYELHYTLYLPGTAGGLATGVWLLGFVAIVWTLDSVIALMLAFPSFNTWRKSFAFRVRRGGYPLAFDVHRSGGVWVWVLLGVIAVTSISMNLREPVVRPVLSMFSTLAPEPESEAKPSAQPQPATLSRERVLELASAAGRQLKLRAAPGGLFFSPDRNYYAVGYFAPGDDYGDYHLGNAWTYWDATTGTQIARTVPGVGSAGDLFLQAQFPLHSGRLFGTAGRIAISFMGVMVATLSVTGILIWIRKRAGRRAAALQTNRERKARRANPQRDEQRGDERSINAPHAAEPAQK
ncbi:Uncharacterized iron-regulated membrane protein [Paraburkholderia kururiensis]|uniref:PepSY-associated TM helix domain-containing protein n=1 Tax=Paraburkholderia kururiensis TaxID=984307 RepID=UPI0039A771B2